MSFLSTNSESPIDVPGLGPPDAGHPLATIQVRSPGPTHAWLLRNVYLAVWERFNLHQHIPGLANKASYKERWLDLQRSSMITEGYIILQPRNYGSS